MTSKIFWRIVFEVVDHQVRLQQEFTCWEDTVPPKRHNRLVVDLQYQIVGDVTIAHDHAIFKGGWLKCKTASLYDYVGDHGCFDGDPGHYSSTDNLGENVEIRAELKLDKVEPEEQGRHYPVFYLHQQELHPVILHEVSYYPDATAFWEIAKLQTTTINFSLEPFDAWHRVRVSQDLGVVDANTGFAVPVWEIYADSWPIGAGDLRNSPIVLGENNSSAMMVDNRPVFLFDPAPQDFYIGGDPVQEIGLHGAIKRLVFDPNSSCGACGL